MKRLSDVVFLTTCIALATVAVAKHRRSTPELPPAREVRGTGLTLDATPALSLSKYDATVLIAVSPKCPFCTESMAFYQQLLSASAQSRRRIQVAFSSTVTVPVLRQYLEQNNIRAATVTPLPPTLPLDGTPTVFLLEPSGRIVDGWLGRLDAAQESALLRRLR